MVSETSFTPGPWEVRTETYDKDIIPGNTHYVAVITRTNDTSDLGHLSMVNGDYHVCKFNPTKDAEAARKMVTDARLIAAAPDLYEALDRLVNWIETEYGCTERVNDAVEALSKARGET